MRAVIVCVDYSDYLAITLPINRHHFEDMLVITSLDDTATIRLANTNDCKVHATNSFYDNAYFNKYKALEQGLDIFGRHGWLCILDADIVWPHIIQPIPPDRFRFPKEYIENPLNLTIGKLYVPQRHMCPSIEELGPVRDEEFAGYSQIFHASDPVLGKPPWHEQWKHAGGGDSFFAKKWIAKNQVRPPFNVLHIGEPGINWCGRVTPYLDGTVHPKAEENKYAVQQMLQTRRKNHNFKHEKL